MKLIVKLIIGIAAGVVIGLVAPEWITRLLVTFKALFGQLLFFTVPLLILFYITAGIAGLPRESGRLLGRTLITAYLSTLLAGLLAFAIASLVVPLLAGTALLYLWLAAVVVLVAVLPGVRLLRAEPPALKDDEAA